MASQEFQLSTYMRARLETWEDSVDINNNTSVVHARIKVWRTNSWSGRTYSSSVTRKIQIGSQVVCDWAGEISHYVSQGEITVAEASRTVNHNDDGSRVVYCACWLTDNASSFFSGSTSYDMTLSTIPRNSSGSFDKSSYKIGDTIKLNFDRKSTSFTHEGYIQFPDRDGWVWAGEKYFSGAGSSYTWTPSASEIDALYARIPNATSATMWADCKTMNGSTQIGTFSCGPATMSVDPSVCSPVFTNFTYKDANSAVVNITGSNQILVQGKSTVEVTISTANKATARKSATMSGYRMSCGGAEAEQAYSTSQIVKNIGSPTQSGTQNLTVTAFDSRLIQTPVSKQVTVIPYSAPTIVVSAARANNFEANTTFTITNATKIAPVKVNNTRKNKVSEFKFRYKKASDTSWGSYANITYTVSADGNITVSPFTRTLDNNYQWNVEFYIKDSFGTVTTVSLLVDVGIPIFRIGTDGYVYNQEHRILTVNDLIPSNNINWSDSITYKVAERVDNSNTGAAWTAWYPSGWDLTFNTVKDAIYEVEVHTSFLGWDRTMEFDCVLEIASGLTQVAKGDSTAVGNVPGIGRIATLLVKATGTSGKVRTRVLLGGANQNITIYEGYLIARRIA